MHVRALTVLGAALSPFPRLMSDVTARMSAPFELTPEILAKREERARQRAARQTPEALAAAAAAAEAEAEAKRELRRQRDAMDASTLSAWAVVDRAGGGGACDLVDIGANLIKVKSDDALVEQLRRCELCGVSRVIVTGTSVTNSKRALELARRPRRGGVTLFSTAGVHPHDAKSCDAKTTIPALRELLSSPECVAVGECGLDYDRMFSPRALCPN